jgi:CheY-like chemotaxis protein/anti-sigma regulatory factor (Ser/Thr protein kinase)
LEATQVAQSVESAVAVVGAQAQKKGVNIDAQIQDRDAYILGDDSRVQQVVWNLLSNAIKFTPPGGAIHVNARVVDRNYEVSVSDTGRGISQEFLPHIFERFSQQESGTGKSFAGLGIGLTIVKHLIDILQGTIEVQSEGVGKGATFIVRLPLTDHRPSELSSDRSVLLKHVQALVVEDDADARALISRILTEAGATVTDVADAETAMSHIKFKMPDVLISDIGMAGLDGYQMLRKLRSSGIDGDQLPAIAVTAFSRLQDRAAALEAGFQVHLTKPVRTAALIAAVAAAIREKKTLASTPAGAGQSVVESADSATDRRSRP